MDILRTPDARFANVADFAFRPKYVHVRCENGTRLRVHYVDEGPRDVAPVLMLHGEPTWAFIYRRLISEFVAAGIRAVAPDLIGFGRSDKPAHGEEYTYARHVEWVRQAIARLALRKIVLLCHDWGGLIGLRLVAEHPEWFAGVIVSNTALPTGEHALPNPLKTWQRFAEHDADFTIGRIIERACVRRLSAAEVAAYDAPFPEESYKAGARRLPALIPASSDDPASAANRRAWQALVTFDKPFLTVFGARDPYTKGADRAFQTSVPGAAGLPHATLPNAGHFIQEDAPEDFARIVTSFVRLVRSM